MDSKSVCIVMSTYNGEKYIDEQLESLFQQSYSNLKIYVRDDDSKDNTKKILKKYALENKISFYEGENLGYAKSFVEILKKAEGFDYYAFCDQDDVWLTDKIKIAIEKLQNLDNSHPLMYFSNVDMCDKDLNHIGYNKDYKTVSFANALVECITYGNTIVINNALRKILVEGNPDEIYAHDRYIYMLATSMGEIYYDKETYIKYRKHPNSVTNQNRGFLEKQIWRIKKFIIHGFTKEIKKQLIEFEQLYAHKLNEKDKKILALFTNEKYSFFKAIKKTLYPHRFRQKITDEIIARITFIFGLI